MSRNEGIAGFLAGLVLAGVARRMVAANGRALGLTPTQIGGLILVSTTVVPTIMGSGGPR